MQLKDTKKPTSLFSMGIEQEDTFELQDKSKSNLGKFLYLETAH